MKKSLLAAIALLSMMNALAQSFTMQNVGFRTQGSNAFQISIVDQNVAWASAANGVVASFNNEVSRTADGGATWHCSPITGMDSSFGILSIAGIDSNTAFAVTGSIPAYGSTIFRTIDGGATWTTVGSGTIYSDATSFAIHIHFWDPAHGIVTGDPVANKFEVYTTSDSGNSWAVVPAANMPNALSNEFTVPKSFDYKGSCVWFGTSTGRVFKSDDYGMHWVVHSLGVSGLTLVSFLSDTLTGIAEVYNGTGYYKRTTDGGNTWSPLNHIGNLYLMFRAIPGTNVFVSFEGEPVSSSALGSSFSIDNGNTWIPIDTAGSGTTNGYGWMEFLDINTGYAGGIAQDSLTDGIYKWNPGVLGINQTSGNKSTFNVFPNPASDKIFISLTHPNSVITILDLDGKVVVEKSIMNVLPDNCVCIDLRNYTPGLYLVELKDEYETRCSKVFIK